jgi:hypothetical protein
MVLMGKGSEDGREGPGPIDRHTTGQLGFTDSWDRAPATSSATFASSGQSHGPLVWRQARPPSRTRTLALCRSTTGLKPKPTSAKWSIHFRFLATKVRRIPGHLPRAAQTQSYSLLFLRSSGLSSLPKTPRDQAGSGAGGAEWRGTRDSPWAMGSGVMAGSLHNSLQFFS